MISSSADIAKTIDHAVLKPDATVAQVAEACALANEYGVATVCVRPCDVQQAAKLLKGSPVKVSAVIGFPHGSNDTSTKIAEALRAIDDGASELDMVINIGRLLSGDIAYVEQDIAAVVMAARRKGVHVKIIIETCYLDGDQIAAACSACVHAQAEFVKTSTGFGPQGASSDVVRQISSFVGTSAKVKASGGIRTLEQTLSMLDAGASRIGTASTKDIIDSARKLEADGMLQKLIPASLR